MLNLAREENWKAAGCGGQLEALVARPEVRALIMADPRVASLLRRLMWALGASEGPKELGLRDGRRPMPKSRMPVPPVIYWIDPPDVPPPITDHGCVVFGYTVDPTNYERRLPRRYRET